MVIAQTRAILKLNRKMELAVKDLESGQATVVLPAMSRPTQAALMEAEPSVRQVKPKHHPIRQWSTEMPRDT